jgi:DnaJ family protein C protein 28
MPEEKQSEQPQRRSARWKITERAQDAIQEAIDAGLFDNLPGKGKPLDLSDDDNPFVPEDKRLAFRILRNAGFSLPWMGERQTIDRDRSAIEREIVRAEERTRSQLQAIERIPEYLRRSRREKLMAQNREFIERQKRAIANLNRRIDDYNLSVPSTTLQTSRLNADRLFEPLSKLL